jgi:ubiquitin-protein ligase
VQFDSSILVRYDKTRPYVLTAVIFPSKDTPYNSGAFAFDIFCPPEYPAVAPKVVITTTGGGSVRFNPNLYVTRRVACCRCRWWWWWW